MPGCADSSSQKNDPKEDPLIAGIQAEARDTSAARSAIGHFGWRTGQTECMILAF
jgi:hypothetical protein